ncbi:hypothetical protein HKT18_12735 [Flavobacterium sp. IMCC34852]|uniref:Uncharacterized protein n=1 Tax=Flavobacterium rivulicola TaxID=2732161 RepID=A0A7Y3VZV7_9FLAO|nr:hypothetical protein [Flavobacterium sp. IMCC34852]NNT73083.1 hypothetical protein [Flavobacterium sp. IMCC34852]
MGILDFFRKNKKSETEISTTIETSLEQSLFANIALEIISPTVEKFGFIRHRIEVKMYSTTIIFKKGKQYIKINSSNYPTDYPYFYNIVLGHGDSDNFTEFDWNSVALWKLKSKIDKSVKAKEYEFPLGEKVKFSISHANQELLKYGDSFLNGDLTLFYETRSEQNIGREPYKIYSPGKNGKYTTTEEPKSVIQKKKFS